MKQAFSGLSRGLVLALILTLLPAAPALAAEHYITGDDQSLEQVAAALGLDGELLALANGRAPGERVAAGTLLLLPLEPTLSLTLEPGDTLYSLAQEYDCTVAELMALNRIADPRRIYAGQRLTLPLAEEAACLRPGSAAVRLEPVLASRGPTAWLWPTEGTISSRFGQRERGWHYGLDIAADAGSLVLASAGGQVSEAGWKNDAYGYTVMLDHGNGQETLYAHCSQLLAEPGQWVTAGQTLALVGSTGNSTGPHLHFELRLNGSCVDPLEYLR